MTLRRSETYEARRARQTMSLPEVLLWQRLKGSPRGIAFRKQHPIGRYRADFYCAAVRLVIEVDGAAHDMGDQPERDLTRTAELETAGYEVLRVPAATVLKNADEAAAVVAFAESPLRQRAALTPPRKRGGLPQNAPGDGEGDHAKHGGGGAASRDASDALRP